VPTIKYNGLSSKYSELAITGKQSVWTPGQQEYRSSNESEQLLATGLFSFVATSPVIPSVDSATGRVDYSSGGVKAISLLQGALLVPQPDGVDIPAVLTGTAKSTPTAIVSLSSTGIYTIPKSTPFDGWGAQFTTIVGMRFSHILIAQLAQTAASASEKWAKIEVKVRAGNRSGAVIASGVVLVGGYTATINTVSVKLFDAAGNEKIVVAIDLGDTYWIQAIAYNKDGASCPMGMSSGIANNYIPIAQAYFFHSSQLWVDVPTANYPLGFQPAYYSNQTALPAAQPPIPDLLLTPVYAVVGREANVYFSGLSMLDPLRVDWDVTYSGNGGQHQNDRFTVNPDAAGTFSLTVSALDPISAVVLATATTSVYVAAAAANVAPILLAIGDSTTANGEVTAELVVLDTADANMALTLIGTKGTNPNNYEATSGWSTTTFTISGSPFYISSAIDVAGYLTNNSFATPTHVVINLGINDIFSATTDAAARLSAQTAAANIAKLIAAIHIASATTKIGIALTTAPSDNQDAFGNTSNYATGQTQRRYKRNWAILCRVLIDAFADKTANLVWLLPYNVTNDTGRNMLTATAVSNSRNSSTVTRQNNGVHLSSSGYLQVADVVYAWMKNVP